MMCYASRTGTKRNLGALRAADWGLLVSRAGVWRTEGFENYVGDNGQWAVFRAWIEARKVDGFSELQAMNAWFSGGWREVPFDEDGFEKFLIWLDAQPIAPRWIVLPDIVAGGAESLALSMRYLNRCLSVAPLVLIAVQDGMTQGDLAPLVGPNVGIFLGGSTEWKLETMEAWGSFCAKRGCHYHVARVNTARRFRRAHNAGADSIDGSSVTRFAETLPELDMARRMPSMFNPKRAVAA